MSGRSEFQSLGADREKALLPMILRWEEGTEEVLDTICPLLTKHLETIPGRFTSHLSSPNSHFKEAYDQNQSDILV